jgi:hypothetical protein
MVVDGEQLLDTLFEIIAFELAQSNNRANTTGRTGAGIVVAHRLHQQVVAGCFQMQARCSGGSAGAAAADKNAKTASRDKQDYKPKIYRKKRGQSLQEIIHPFFFVFFN